MVQKNLGTLKSERPISFTRIDKNHLKCDCTNKSNVNGVWEPILYTYDLDEFSRQKTSKRPRLKTFKKISESVASGKFSSEDDDHKPVEFNGETISNIHH